MTNIKRLHGEPAVEPAPSSPETLLDRAAYAQTLWASAFAGHKLPDPEDAFFIRALSKFSMAEFEYAVGRTARKFPKRIRPPFVTLDDLAGYCVGVLNGQRREAGK
jgi:hypothetical protein